MGRDGRLAARRRRRRGRRRVSVETETEELIDLYRTDRYAAHQGLFAHRHEDETPEFHREIIDFFWSDADRLVLLAFRGSGKSTLSEEAVAIGVCYQTFRNCLLIGS